MLVYPINLYATRDKDDKKHLVDEREMHIFLGIILNSRYHVLSQENYYCCAQQDLDFPIICNTVSRNRFQEIKRHFLITDN